MREYAAEARQHLLGHRLGVAVQHVVEEALDIGSGQVSDKQITNLRLNVVSKVPLVGAEGRALQVTGLAALEPELGGVTDSRFRHSNSLNYNNNLI